MGAAPPRPTVLPRGCEFVNATCPVEATIYGYYPFLPANAFFAGFFGLAALIHIFYGIRYKTWSYMFAISLGCIAECVGYVGRVMMNNNPWNDMAFNIQVVLLIFAPSFLAAGIYLTLKHIVLQFGADWSRLRPGWYTWIFVCCDVSSLAMQSAGGAMAAMADPGEKIGDVGTNLMIAGIIWQVIVLVIFALIVAEYSYRTYQRRNILTHDALQLWASRSFKLYCGAVVAAYLFILVRCAYRIPELLGGWGGELMRIEIEFIILEGVMICLCVLAQTVFHPGKYFPALASQGKQKHVRVKMVDDAEMEPLGSYQEVRPAGRYEDERTGRRYEDLRN
ncbi:RTA1 like protein-domain-containing protein [Paraphoma chrysanthemicola]|uniref:RTA1 like protein-domain-containing protein n=1 Tax=Paraphoma chrysanthemicola TaxID=798071 RepID=A0A8K0QVQ5_9PLEO|nr:RTA1 like protein-domain-containing protein [Paraphoma chrysanthemicola]